MERKRRQGLDGTSWKPVTFWFYPAEWCQYTCENAMSSDCVTECAPNRDTSHFELKTSIKTLHELPRFSLKNWLEEMTPNERQVVAGLYLSKIADLLMGINDDREAHELTELREMEELVRGLTEEE